MPHSSRHRSTSASFSSRCSVRATSSRWRASRRTSTSAESVASLLAYLGQLPVGLGAQRVGRLADRPCRFQRFGQPGGTPLGQLGDRSGPLGRRAPLEPAPLRVDAGLALVLGRPGQPRGAAGDRPRLLLGDARGQPQLDLPGPGLLRAQRRAPRVLRDRAPPAPARRSSTRAAARARRHRPDDGSRSCCSSPRARSTRSASAVAARAAKWPGPVRPGTRAIAASESCNCVSAVLTTASCSATAASSRVAAAASCSRLALDRAQASSAAADGRPDRQRRGGSPGAAVGARGTEQVAVAWSRRSARDGR